MSDQLPEILYHYTSYQAATCILEEKPIRLYRSDSMNDPTEVVVGVRLLVDIILELADKHSGEKEVLRRLGTCYYHTIHAFSYYGHHTHDNLVKFGVNRDQARIRVFYDQYVQKSDDVLKAVRVVYMTSFCEQIDAIDLWRPYGDDGRGVSIGVEYSALHEMRLERERDDCLHSYPLFIKKVLYEKENYQRSVRKLLEQMIAEAGSPNAHTLEQLCESLFALVVCYKDRHYASEREWRLFVYAKRYKHSPEFDHSKNRPRPFLNTPPIAFKVIATGPCSQFNGAMDDAWRHFLSTQCGLDLQNLKLQHMDSIPYRRRQ